MEGKSQTKVRLFINLTKTPTNGLLLDHEKGQFEGDSSCQERDLLGHQMKDTILNLEGDPYLLTGRENEQMTGISKEACLMNAICARVNWAEFFRDPILMQVVGVVYATTRLW